MKRIKRYIAFFLLLVVSVGAIGCGGEDGPSQTATVTGTVADTALNPISGASVVVGSVSSSTGSDGTYILERVTSGLQNFSVSAPGYLSVSKTIDVTPMATTYVPKTILEQKDSKSTDIGSGGGEVANSDGSVKLSIPAEALSSDLSIVITNCSLLSAPLPVPDGYKLVSLVYISPTGTVLAKPATLTISAPSETPVSFYWFDSSASAWQSLGEGTVSTDTVSVSISNFGWIAAVVPVSVGNISGRVITSGGAGIAGADVRTPSSLAVTDSSGNYTLSNLPVGTVSVTASKIGYIDNSVSVVVQAGETETADNITLSPVSSNGSVAGKIMPASGSGVIAGARVVAQGKTSYSDSNGDYVISELSAGTVTVSVYAYGYVNQDASVTITTGHATSQNFSLSAVSVADFSDGFESESGWSAAGLWNRIQNITLSNNTLAPYYVTFSSGDDGSLPAAHGGSYSYWFGDSATGSFIGEQRSIPPDTELSGGTSAFLATTKGDLISPSINLVGYSTVTLTFWTWWEVEARDPSTFDQMKVNLSDDDGTNWTMLLKINPEFTNPEDVSKPYSSGGFFTPGVWVKHQYDLTSYAGKTIKLAFSFDAMDLQSNGFRGWFIDDVSISKDAISASSSRKLF
ncbi:MAG: carboxypeptidase regulatory-like domain-containing protein [Candidatus Margulisiibacteriota bacterium]